MKNLKNKKIFISVVGFILLFYSSSAYASTSIHLSIKTPSTTIYDQVISVTPCDSDNHGTLRTTPYCAVLQSGIPSTWSWQWAPGVYLTSLNGISGYTSKDKNNNDVYHYWNWSLNSVSAMVGLNEYDLAPNDLVSLDFIDPVTPLAPTGSEPLLPSSPTTPDQDSSDQNNKAKTFDKENAIKFLISQQKDNGSFGEDLYTDWSTLALAGEDGHQENIIRLIKHFGETNISGDLITDYERHAMALMSLGLNPYNTNGENYIKKITDGFDGKQFGDIDKDNDDVFALIVLQNAGYKAEDKIIKDDIYFVLGRQKIDGSWDGSPDLTGAGIEALSSLKEDPKIEYALDKARGFLKQSQKSDGSWGNNASSTAWVLEGILSLGEKPEDWKIGMGKDSRTPLDFLYNAQDTDGSIKNESMANKIWETAYVASAMSGKTWSQIMRHFDKQEAENISPSITEQNSKDNTNPPEKPVKKLSIKKFKKENTASVVNSLTDPKETKTSPPSESWFDKFLKSVFGFF